MAKKRRGDDPVARLQEAARWSGFELVVAGRCTQPPRWIRRMIIGAFVLMAFVGVVVGLIGLVTRHESPAQEFLKDCPRLESLEPGQTVPGCFQVTLPTGH